MIRAIKTSALSIVKSPSGENAARVEIVQKNNPLKQNQQYYMYDVLLLVVVLLLLLATTGNNNNIYLFFNSVHCSIYLIAAA